MINIKSSFESIAAEFRQLGIPTDKPGFCDHQNFLKIERSDPAFLNIYAKYVHKLPLELAYLERARNEIPVIVKALHEELVRSGRQGACVDASAVLLRILEREGFWCYSVKGSLTIDFPKELGTRYFYTIDVGEFVAAHAWIVAPPFKIIDFTIRQQQNSDQENEHLPEMILVEEAANAKGTVEDIFSPLVTQAFLRSGVSKKNFFSQILPHAVDFMAEFPAQKFAQGRTHFKYIPTAIGAPDCALESLIGMNGKDGKNGASLYQDIVCPALKKYRER